LFHSERLPRLIVFALKDFGEENVSSVEIGKIRAILFKHETKDSVLKNIELAPAWIRKILLKMFEL
jgi:hypothetical protein